MEEKGRKEYKWKSGGERKSGRAKESRGVEIRKE